jgi:hypothetical protein
VNPVGAIGDLRDVIRDSGSNRLRTAIAALVITFMLFWLIGRDTWRLPPPRPTIVYINSWPASRTMAETKKFIEANQKRNDLIAADEAKRAEEMRQMYKAVGRASGMDVDGIEQKAKAEAEKAGTKQQAPVAQP